VARPPVLLLAALAALAAGSGWAQEPPRSVEVKGLKDPDMRSYRSVAAGLDAFDKHHAMAPGVDQLRFRLVAATGAKALPMSAATLHIVGSNSATAVPIGADGVFTVPRDATARADNADLLLNHKKGVFKTRLEVRTPGLPANVRRLGDLRLECQATVAMIKEDMPWHLNLFLNGVFQTRNWCGTQDFIWEADTPGTLSGATLVSGARREQVKISDRKFMIPIGDTAWPDDALIELEFAGRE
jgi:hypothetical protein